MRTLRVCVLIIGVGGAASSAGSQQVVPIRPLGPIVATATEPFGALTGVRQLTNGRVLVNDGSKRRLLLLDSSLANPVVVADSTSATSNAYGARQGGMIPYIGDSTLFIDAAGLSMLVIDPGGKIARIASVPRAADISWLTSPTYGAGFDGNGNLVYQSRVPAHIVQGPDGALVALAPDSAPIIRISLATRIPDTAAWLKLPQTTPLRSVRSFDGRTATMSLPVVTYRIADDWALAADGSIALIYAQDFHVDWITSGGERTVASRAAFPWVRLGDDVKAHMIDSLQAEVGRLQRSSDSSAACRPPVAPGAVTTRTLYVPPAAADLPDYLPPFYPGTAKPDAEGNVWIREFLQQPVGDSGLVYDVINRKGELADRVQLPRGTALVGFGPGVAYLDKRDPLPPRPLPPPDPGTGCRPAAQPILIGDLLPPLRLMRARIR